MIQHSIPRLAESQGTGNTICPRSPEGAAGQTVRPIRLVSPRRGQTVVRPEAGVQKGEPEVVRGQATFIVGPAEIASDHRARTRTPSTDPGETTARSPPANPRETPLKPRAGAADPPTSLGGTVEELTGDVHPLTRPETPHRNARGGPESDEGGRWGYG